MAGTVDANVLAPHRAELDRILDQLAPVAEVLVEDTDTLIDLLEALRAAGPLIPRMIEDHEALTYGIFDTFVIPGQEPIFLGDGPAIPQAGSDAVTALLDPAPEAPR